MVHANSITTEEFLDRCNQKYGDRFDYSKVIYKNWSTKMIFICRLHGEFTQTSNSHLKRIGCKRCAGNAKLTTEEFVKKSIEVHGTRYDYSLSEYSTGDKKIKITCKIHGTFEQRPNSHIKGHGCVVCGNIIINDKTRCTTEEFIENSIKKYGTRFDYSLVEYVNSETKIQIICKIHGIFKQIPHRHLQHGKCPNCSKISRKEKLSLSREEFIAKCIEAHGAKYDYSQTNYINNQTKIKIKCKNCDLIFEQRATNHINDNKGCYNCSIRKKLTKEKFIERAIKCYGNKFDYAQVEYKNSYTRVKVKCNDCNFQFLSIANTHIQGKESCKNCFQIGQTKIFIDKCSQIHKFKYNYDLVKYKNNHAKVKIICPSHGEFKQIPSDHVNEHGCPKCSYHVSKPEIKWLDSLNVSTEFRQYKMKINKRRFNVDGFNPETNTLYEFLGDFWHGNPDVFPPDKLNTANHKTFGELHKKTLTRLQLFKDSGYNIVYIWENDWKKQEILA